jgi:SAM-dependent methyltransferase
VLIFAPEVVDGDGSDVEYDWDELTAAEERHFWFRTRQRLVVWALGRYFRAARRLIEIGCGSGFVLDGVRRSYPELSIAGSDIGLRGLERAAVRLAGVPVLQADARRLPFRGEFDVACAFDVLEHIEEDESVLAELHRALRPGGGVLLTVPQHPRLWSTTDEFTRHKRRYTRGELLGKLRRAAFEPLRVTSFFSFLLPALALARARHRRVEEVDPREEFRISGRLNGALEAVSHLEQRLLKLGLSLPVGSSLLVVARRAD